MAVKKACKNHPNKLTARRCFYCKEHICSHCQLRLGGHLFCSRKCYYAWRWQAVRVKIKKWPLPSVGLALLFILLLALFLYVKQRFSQLEKQTVRIVKMPADSMQSPQFIVWDTLRSEQSYKLQIKVHNTQPGNLTALWRDGAFTASLIPNSDSVVFAEQYLRPGRNNFKIFMLLPTNRLTLVDSFAIDFHSARLSYLSKAILHGNLRYKRVALTFDGGASNRGTKTILEILEEKKVRCTLFLTGGFIKHFPELVKQIVADGHQIGNHTLNHPHLTQYEINKTQQTRDDVDRQVVHHQLKAADSLMYALTRHSMAPYWRAPYGEYNKDILGWAAEAGYRHVGWSPHCDTWDWEADTASVLYRTPPEILNYLLKVEQREGLNGKIILMHLGSERKNNFPYEILPQLIDELRHRGYELVTVSELIAP